LEKFVKIVSIVVRLLAVLIVVDGLAGCVVAPPYGYAPGYYPAPAYYAAPTVGVGFRYGGGWHGR